METAPITYQSYRAVFLETGPSLWSTILVVRDFACHKRLHSFVAMVFMVITMVFTLCFPTFASAMTGYTSIVKAYVPDHQDGNWIRFDRFTQVLYVIHDGDRIGHTKEYFVTEGEYHAAAVSIQGDGYCALFSLVPGTNDIRRST